MIVVVTGMVGIDKKSYLQKVCRIASKNQKDVTLCNVGDMMYAEASDIGLGRILDIPMKRLNSLRRSVFKDIIAKSKTAKNLIVNTHATFRWRHGLFPAVDFDQIQQLKPDMYVCMVDSVDTLHYRLKSEHPITHSLKDIVVWREEEILGTEMLRAGIDQSVPLFCFARGAVEPTAQTFYRLVFEPERKKVYLSFPMTHIVDMPEIQTQIETFRNTVKKHFTCFDPADIEESYLPVMAKKAIEQKRKYINRDILGHKIRLDVNELLQIEKDINSQIYTRDFSLIDQSDMIISYIPSMPDGKAILSSGVERELQHAHEAARQVYVVWTPKVNPSVFVTQTATEVFADTQQAIDFFKKKGFVK